MWTVANDAFHNPHGKDEPWIAVELHTGLRADAEFIAHARTDIPALCDALDAVRQFGVIASRTAGVEAERAEREHQRANDNAEKLRVTRLRAERAEAQVATLTAEVRAYRNAITWNTTCFSCSKLLDSCYAETVRAEKAEAERDAAVEQHRRVRRRTTLNRPRRKDLEMARPIAIGLYVACIALANWLTEHYGMINVGFGLTATAGTIAAGLALFARDLVQDTAGRIAVIAGIGAGAALTYLISPSLAYASAVAFLIAELADMAVYTPLRAKGWARAVVASNTVGAVIDTFVFLHLAGFPITTHGIAGQLVGKLLYATLLPVALVIACRRTRR
jgi:uncharacterized PurR-regulated membrane protein YhhQ (DUF165 family)